MPACYRPGISQAGSAVVIQQADRLVIVQGGKRTVVQVRLLDNERVAPGHAIPVEVTIVADADGNGALVRVEDRKIICDGDASVELIPRPLPPHPMPRHGLPGWTGSPPMISPIRSGHGRRPEGTRPISMEVQGNAGQNTGQSRRAGRDRRGAGRRSWAERLQIADAQYHPERRISRRPVSPGAGMRKGLNAGTPRYSSTFRYIRALSLAGEIACRPRLPRSPAGLRLHRRYGGDRPCRHPPRSHRVEAPRLSLVPGGVPY